MGTCLGRKSVVDDQGPVHVHFLLAMQNARDDLVRLVQDQETAARQRGHVPFSDEESVDLWREYRRAFRNAKQSWSLHSTHKEFVDHLVEFNQTRTDFHRLSKSIRQQAHSAYSANTT